MQVNSTIIQGCINGERKAQFELYKICYGPMMKICLRYHHNREDAKALVNESFLKVCERIDTWRNSVPFELWIRRITVNTTIDHYRKNRNKNEAFQTHDTSEQFWESKMTSVNIAEAEMTADGLRALIHSLPPISQQVFNMCVLDGYDYDEVAQMLSISESTCRWHVHFARKKLQELVHKYFHTESIPWP